MLSLRNTTGVGTRELSQAQPDLANPFGSKCIRDPNKSASEGVAHTN